LLLISLEAAFAAVTHHHLALGEGTIGD